MTAVQTLTQQNLQSVLSFDGKDDYISLPPTSFGGAITIEAWVYLETASHYWQRLVDFGNGPQKDNILLAWRTTTGNMSLYTFGNGRSTSIMTNEVFPTKKWVHVVGVNDGNGNAYIYWDGELKASGSNHICPSNITRNNQYIGRSNWSQDGYFIGKMADIRIWNKARSQEEIKQDMNYRLTGKEEGLMAYFPLNGDASDQTSNNNNGTIHGCTWTEEKLDCLQPAVTNVEIADIVYHGHVKRTQSDEYIEIRNSGNAAADLSNWKVTSIGKNQLFAFPEGTSLAADQMIRVYTNEVHQESGGFSFGSKTAIWNDKGDMAKLLDTEGKEVSSFSYGDQAKSENSVDSIKAELGIPGLKVNISESDIKQLMTPQTKVSFSDAFRGAMKSYMKDGNLSESPLYILKELPGEYGLSDNPNAQEINEKMKELLNDCGIKLLTDAEDPSDEWAGKVMCDETGESYGTNSYWIFQLSPSQFTDMNYAVVDKAGVQPTINWGFS